MRWQKVWSFRLRKLSYGYSGFIYKRLATFYNTLPQVTETPNFSADEYRSCIKYYQLLY